MQLAEHRNPLIAILAIAFLGIAGWATAAYMAVDCTIAFLHDLNDRGTEVHGFNDENASLTVWPFLVDIEVDVPRGARTSRYSARYLTLPWGVIQISHDEIR